MLLFYDEHTEQEHERHLDPLSPGRAARAGLDL